MQTAHLLEIEDEFERKLKRHWSGGSVMQRVAIGRAIIFENMGNEQLVYPSQAAFGNGMRGKRKTDPVRSR